MSRIPSSPSSLSTYLCTMIHAGILGGGQLGRMLLQAAANYPVVTHVLENDPNCPAAHLCHHFTLGDIRSFDDVLAFGRGLEVITIEIEQVNLEALEQLEREGVTVYPKPAALKLLRSKVDQKQFYEAHQLPTAPFVITTNKRELYTHTHRFPAVHKVGEGGYDGRGVMKIRSEADISSAFDAPAVLEDLVLFVRELSVIVAAMPSGEVVSYAPVEMVADPNLHQLDYQLAPANIPPAVAETARKVSEKLVRALESPGLFAVELFETAQGNILINETAPRVHNSGHHTIEAAYTSQFDMVWRILLNMPAGDTRLHHASAMINLIGAKDHAGPVVYEGLASVLAEPGLYIHLYGKAETRPGRKMGHITLLATESSTLPKLIHQIKSRIQVNSST